MHQDNGSRPPRQQRSIGPATSFPARVRYRAAAAGEARRVVHIAMSTVEGDWSALCGVRLPAADAEQISDLLGMPCMACTRVLAARSQVTIGADPPVVLEAG
ncbi:hypothetical protein [Saccharopolyspora sp. 6M]|uniref:hypothetical protein n=1 Tax=Saccharopolyspora sp. 6M TaxID=2877237 RepID=UPI001CD24235|nr:hypothetical protein [Saccharopolyspora sp. 6M]MCA1227470.1 hypothetical protein [Saccharopolyspora sp. 6M]